MEPYIRFNVGEKAREQWVSAAHATAAQPLFAPRMTNSAARPNPPTTRISRSLSAAWRRSSAVTMQQKNNKQSDTTPFTLFWRSCCIYFILFAAVKSGENSRLDMFSRDQGYLLQWLFLSPSLWFFTVVVAHRQQWRRLFAWSRDTFMKVPSCLWPLRPIKAIFGVFPPWK